VNTKLSYSSTLVPPNPLFDIGLPKSSIKYKAVLKHWMNIITAFFTALMDDEFTLVRLIVTITSAACLWLAITGSSLYYYQYTNLIQSVLGAIALALTFTSYGKSHIRVIGNFFIYQLDFFNAVLLLTSSFDDKLSYQYIIYFFVSSLFFNNKRTLLLCVGMNILLVASFSFVSTAHSTSISDFYTAYLASGVALVALMLKRFSMEHKLVEKEERYRLLAENAADIICTHDKDGGFEFISPAVVHLTGYDPSELLGNKAFELIHPDDTRQFKLNLIKACSDSTEQGTSFQYRLKIKDNTYIWLETVIKRLPSKGVDLTQQFLSHTRSFQVHQEYIDQINQNTSALQSSNKDLETFAYISSHDMQEPLRMITSYMQLLRRKYKPVLDDQALEYIDYAIKGATNLQVLIKDLLSYSTINKKEVQLNLVNMEMLFDDVLTGLQMFIEEKNAQVYLCEELIPILGDKHALMQIIQNLIQNGIKYNTSTVPEVRITCTESRSWVTYTISDNGIGMEDKYFKQIFEPFKRLQNKHDFPGTGLGLSICKKIIDRHGGMILVESTVGIGSTFHIKIPKVHTTHEQPAPVATTALA
jgi:PAS domain S-box-containing protein